MTVLGLLSYAFSKSMKTICWSFFCSLYLSISWQSKKIAFVVDRSPRHKTKLVCSDIYHSSQAMLNHYLPKLHGMTHKLNSSVNISFLLEDRY
jgi:hypothetical protein